ncbi:hypothetical protein D3C81_1245460 [compost metagenome]
MAGNRRAGLCLAGRGYSCDRGRARTGLQVGRLGCLPPAPDERRRARDRPQLGPAGHRVRRPGLRPVLRAGGQRPRQLRQAAGLDREQPGAGRPGLAPARVDLGQAHARAGSQRRPRRQPRQRLGRDRQQPGIRRGPVDRLRAAGSGPAVAGAALHRARHLAGAAHPARGNRAAARPGPHRAARTAGLQAGRAALAPEPQLRAAAGDAPAGRRAAGRAGVATDGRHIGAADAGHRAARLLARLGRI